MNIEIVVAVILGLAVLLGWIRLWLWHRSALMVGQHSTGRLFLLALLQLIGAALLHLALFPPMAEGGSGSLRIATAGPSRLTDMNAGAPLILLPEASAMAGGEAVPDLATALRRHPGVTRIDIIGDGLGPRDIDAARPLIVHYDPAPLRPGITYLAPPPIVAPGARFTVGGTVAGWPDMTVELVDPADRLTDSAAPDKDGRFLLGGTARAAGTTSFTLRVRSGKRVVEHATVPVWIADSPRPRLLILAGAPGPEVKYLRRWASDAGFDITVQMNAGGGIALGDPPVALDAAGLRRFDVAIVDERTWPTLRGPLLSAVRGGMGLILRAGGAIDGATRSQWQALGFGSGGPGGIASIALPKVAEQAIARTRHGIGHADAPVDVALPEELAPDISRLGITPGGANAVSLLQDAAGIDLAAWRSIGAGRVALFTAIDSYGLTLTGRGDLYADWWNALLGAVVRPAPAGRMVTQTAWAGERMTLCGLAGEVRIEAPDGGQASILPDAGCGAFWPTLAGWHMMRAGADIRAVYVQPPDALPAMRATRDRQAMALLRSDTSAVTGRDVLRHPQSAWPFWLAWLVVSALLWWLERSRLGRRAIVSVDTAKPAVAADSSAP